MEIFITILLLFVGFVLLIKGADFFVEGASEVARYLKIPTLVIGLTLVSIGTSLPEISVSISSAIANATELSFGNVVGSNIFNILIVVGVSSIIAPLTVPKEALKYDIPIYIFIIILTTIFAFFISPYKIMWYEALILFIIFILYLIFIVLRSKKDIKENNEIYIKKRPMYLNIIIIIAGAAAIIFGGDLVVEHAANIARMLKMSELLVGLTIIAVGTSLPELVTSIVACKKGQVDIAVGNAIGSCIFNIILILGLSGMISPIVIEASAYIDLIIMSLSIILMFIFSLKSNKINRIQGIILTLIYIGYLTYIILRN